MVERGKGLRMYGNWMKWKVSEEEHYIKKTGKGAIMKQSTGNTASDGCWKSEERDKGIGEK